MKKPPQFNVDVPKVPSHTAAALMAHHLSLATAYWEATDLSVEGLIELIHSAMTENELAQRAAGAWLVLIDELYEIEEQEVRRA